MSNFVLLGAFLTYTVWKFLPTLIYYFYPNTISASFISPGDDKPPILNREIEQLILILTNFGFIPLGIKVEKLPLWKKNSYEINLYSQEECCFASIPIEQKGAYYYFYTPFKNGGIVLTNNGKHSINQESNYLISNIPEVETENILEAHRIQVQKLRKAGQQPIDTFTQESRIESTKMFYAADQSRRLMRKRGIWHSLLALYYAVIPVVFFWYFSN